MMPYLVWVTVRDVRLEDPSETSLRLQMALFFTRPSAFLFFFFFVVAGVVARSDHTYSSWRLFFLEPEPTSMFKFRRLFYDKLLYRVVVKPARTRQLIRLISQAFQFNGIILYYPTIVAVQTKKFYPKKLIFARRITRYLSSIVVQSRIN